jgi:hypothetical protein
MKFASLTATSLKGCLYCTLLVLNSPALAQSNLLPSRPVWEPSPMEPFNRSLGWTAVDQFGEFPSQFSPVPANMDPKVLAAKPRVEGPYKSRGIYGIGGGVRPGSYTGDPTNGIVTGRIGYKLDDVFSISLRPSVIINSGYYNNDNNNNNNNNYEGWEYRFPLTLDLFHRGLVTPFVGGGIATNVDNLGYTDGMLTAGVDLNITKWLTIGSNVNYIYQSNINDTDWEVLSMIYLRF